MKLDHRVGSVYSAMSRYCCHSSKSLTFYWHIFHKNIDNFDEFHIFQNQSKFKMIWRRNHAFERFHLFSSFEIARLRLQTSWILIKIDQHFVQNMSKRFLSSGNECRILGLKRLRFLSTVLHLLSIWMYVLQYLIPFIRDLSEISRGEGG